MLDELVQDALEYVLKRNRNLRGLALYRAAQDALKPVGKTDKYKRATTVVEASGKLANSDKLLPIRKKRPPRMPHTPKGLVRAVKPGSHIETIDMRVGDPPTPSQVLMAHRIRDEICEPILHGVPDSLKLRDSLPKAYAALFGAPPEHAWAQVLLGGISEAKKALVTSEMKKAVDANPKLLGTVTGHAVTYGLTKQGRQNLPNMPNKFQVSVRPVCIYESVDKATYAVWGELVKGKPEVLYYLEGLHKAWLPPESYEHPDTWARRILLRTISRLAQWPSDVRLPEYVLDCGLIAFLVKRMGFEGGGGQDGQITSARMLELLVAPIELANEIEAYGKRIANRQSKERAIESDTAEGIIINEEDRVEDALDIEQRFLAMAKRVRDRADQR